MPPKNVPPPDSVTWLSRCRAFLSLLYFLQCRMSLLSEARVRGEVTRLGCSSGLLVLRFVSVVLQQSRAAFRRRRSLLRSLPCFGFVCFCLVAALLVACPCFSGRGLRWRALVLVLCRSLSLSFPSRCSLFLWVSGVISGRGRTCH